MFRNRNLVTSQVRNWTQAILGSSLMGDSWLQAPNLTGDFTVPGTLAQTFDSSGTYTPAAGVTRVNVVVVGGGASGSTYVYVGVENNYMGGAGGGGGAVRVYRDVPVSGSVTVTVGAGGSSSSFGSLVAEAGNGQLASSLANAGASQNLLKSAAGSGGINDGGRTWPAPSGQAGPSVNGTLYAGGGGGGKGPNGSGAAGAGGAGGGGGGGKSATNATSGTVNTGGGGGGAYTGTAGTGGSGRVLVFVE